MSIIIRKLLICLLANRRITVREIAVDLGISIGSCHSILIDNLGDDGHSHIVACTRLLGQKQHTNDTAATVFPRSGPLWLFLVSETEEAHERTTLRHDWRDKDGIEGRVEQDTKKYLFEVLRRLEKTLAQMCNIHGNYFEERINKNFLKIHKIRAIFWTHYVKWQVE